MVILVIIIGKDILQLYVQDNLPITDDPKSVIDKDLEEAWWFAIK